MTRSLLALGRIAIVMVAALAFLTSSQGAQAAISDPSSVGPAAERAVLPDALGARILRTVGQLLERQMNADEEEEQDEDTTADETTDEDTTTDTDGTDDDDDDEDDEDDEEEDDD